ncbi:hypothetical protein E2C01_002091 [Portunus trituberculatus]|uniref:Uncharacterized protein n=1 Tax=Portunus trituberculatus TaxID=210409 RepID=A0A5B7CK18_PORTR|nr:hypothetical protein [Portunus trituberculatus]
MLKERFLRGRTRSSQDETSWGWAEWGKSCCLAGAKRDGSGACGTSQDMPGALVFWITSERRSAGKWLLKLHTDGAQRVHGASVIVQDRAGSRAGCDLPLLPHHHSLGRPLSGLERDSVLQSSWPWAQPPRAAGRAVCFKPVGLVLETGSLSPTFRVISCSSDGLTDGRWHGWFGEAAGSLADSCCWRPAGVLKPIILGGNGPAFPGILGVICVKLRECGDTSTHPPADITRPPCLPMELPIPSCGRLYTTIPEGMFRGRVRRGWPETTAGEESCGSVAVVDKTDVVCVVDAVVLRDVPITHPETESGTLVMFPPANLMSLNHPAETE